LSSKIKRIKPLYNIPDSGLWPDTDVHRQVVIGKTPDSIFKTRRQPEFSFEKSCGTHALLQQGCLLQTFWKEKQTTEKRVTHEEATD
jgi:hypothetical protein